MTVVVMGVWLLLAYGLGAAQEKPPAPRRNLVTFFSKCRAGGPVTVAYIGGSVTSGSWRPFTTKWLQEQFKGVDVKEVNAAVGGTGSQLGVFRFGKHVLQHDPDLAFIEFAINDRASPDNSVLATMEGLVRQAWRREKKPDLVFVYTTHHDLACPMNRHQAVADAYGIPTVDFQQVIKAVVGPGHIDWPILAPDNVHPNDWGHAIYAATLATFLRRQMALTEAVPPPATLPPVAFSDTYETARLVPVTEGVPEGWEVLPPAGNFRDGSILAKEVGRTITFKFSATQVGLYFQMRKDAGIVSYEIDGQPAGELDTSWGPTYKFNRDNATIVKTDLPQADHTLTITVTDKKHELSAGHEFHLGYLMLAG
jgi:lysophospholipase L1-like esterase